MYLRLMEETPRERQPQFEKTFLQAILFDNSSFRNSANFQDIEMPFQTHWYCVTRLLLFVKRAEDSWFSRLSSRVVSLGPYFQICQLSSLPCVYLRNFSLLASILKPYILYKELSNFWFKISPPKCNPHTCHFFLTPEELSQPRPLTHSLQHNNTLWAWTGHPQLFCSVKVIAVMIHNHCLFPSRKCHSDLSYLLHLEYHHLNPRLFHIMTLHLQESLNYYLTFFQCANSNIIAHYTFSLGHLVFENIK